MLHSSVFIHIFCLILHFSLLSRLWISIGSVCVRYLSQCFHSLPVFQIKDWALLLCLINFLSTLPCSKSQHYSRYKYTLIKPDVLHLKLILWLRFISDPMCWSQNCVSIPAPVYMIFWGNYYHSCIYKANIFILNEHIRHDRIIHIICWSLAFHMEKSKMSLFSVKMLRVFIIP